MRDKEYKVGEIFTPNGKVEVKAADSRAITWLRNIANKEIRPDHKRKRSRKEYVDIPLFGSPGVNSDPKTQQMASALAKVHELTHGLPFLVNDVPDGLSKEITILCGHRPHAKDGRSTLGFAFKYIRDKPYHNYMVIQTGQMFRNRYRWQVLYTGIEKSSLVVDMKQSKF